MDLSRWAAIRCRAGYRMIRSCLTLCAVWSTLLFAQASLAQQSPPFAGAAMSAVMDVENQMRAETETVIRANKRTLDNFEQTLAAQPSATKALQGWCEARHYSLEHPAQIVARRSRLGLSSLPPAGLREQLGVGPREPLQVRHVALFCGNALLSLADNWYVPARLTPDMNASLEKTYTPFGAVAASLHFTREPLASQRGAADGCAPDAVLTHRALLRLPDGRPLALVLECYQPDVLAPPGPINVQPPLAPPRHGSPWIGPPSSNPPSPTLP